MLVKGGTGSSLVDDMVNNIAADALATKSSDNLRCYILDIFVELLSVACYRTLLMRSQH